MIDNYDSFVFNLSRYFVELGQEIQVYRNDKISVEEIRTLNPDGIILSPGPKTPSHTGICSEVIRCFSDQIPILGICLGHQTIGDVLGARVTEGLEPSHGKISPVFHQGDGVFRGLPSPMNVTRYHSLVIDAGSLPAGLFVTATTKDGVIMGIRHKTLLLEGVQFHPEAVLTEHGHALLQNFIDQCVVIRNGGCKAWNNQ
jgi:para-aminobenzoate synthetase component 2